MKETRVPVWEKYLLTVQEASEYFHIGEKNLRRIVDDDPEADYILMNGNRVMFKRRMFEKFIDETSAI